MSVNLHTPGPWFWRTSTGLDDYAALVSDAGGGPIIQTSHDVDPDHPDAKLIAASFDLADALEDAARRCAEVDGGSYPGHECAFCESWLAALRKAGRIA